MQERNAASVLPLPVGAMRSACSPRPMAAHPRTCTGVGAANAARNHSRVASPKPSIARAYSALLPAPARLRLRFRLRARLVSAEKPGTGAGAEAEAGEMGARLELSSPEHHRRKD